MIETIIVIMAAWTTVLVGLIIAIFNILGG